VWCQWGARLEAEECPFLRPLRGGPSLRTSAWPPDAQSSSSCRRHGEGRRGTGTPGRHIYRMGPNWTALVAAAAASRAEEKKWITHSTLFPSSDESSGLPLAQQDCLQEKKTLRCVGLVLCGLGRHSLWA
jgi:hypothetical protein